MLGLYLFARLIGLAIVGALVAFIFILYLAWLLLAAVGRALVDPDFWRPRKQKRPRVPPSKPRNERLYYSNRR